MDRSIKGNILIVDDTPDNLSVLRQMLTEKGHRVRPAISGDIALKAAGNDLPDLILLDIVMPGMDGYEVCHRLKSDPSACEVLARVSTHLTLCAQKKELKRRNEELEEKNSLIAAQALYQGKAAGRNRVGMSA